MALVLSEKAINSMTPLEKTLLEFALVALAYETCQQGGDDPCGRPAAYEAIDGDHIMCGSCANGWYLIKENERDEYTAQDFRRGLARKLKHGWYKRIKARRRDDSEAHNPLKTEEVEVLIVLESKPTRRKVVLKTRGELVRTCRSSVTRTKVRIDKGQLLLALENEIEGWVPVLFRGRIEFVPEMDLKLSKKRKKAKP